MNERQNAPLPLSCFHCSDLIFWSSFLEDSLLLFAKDVSLLVAFTLNYILYHTTMATSGAGNPPVPQQQPSDETTTSPLHAAMKMADIVRSSLNNHNKNRSTNDDSNRDFRTTPGLVEGVATGVLTLVLLTPVRSLVLRTATAKSLGLLPDLVVTTSQIMIAANAALYAGSLYGSWHYLQTFTQIPVDAVSPTVDGICRQSLEQFAAFDNMAAQTNSATPASSSSWNPNAIVLTEFAKAMALCRQRAQQQAAAEADQLQETKMTWWK